MRMLSLVIYVVITSAVSLYADPAMAWNDATHMAVVKAAGLDDYVYLAVGADFAKEKAGELENRNHFNNTPKGVVITPDMVLSQFNDYNRAEDADGHLYGAIIASINDYMGRSSDSKYARYPFGYAAHYIADLSMPFHNIAYESFNRMYHGANDGIVENIGVKNESVDAKVDRLAVEIQKRMSKLPPIQLAADEKIFYRELASHIAAIANTSAALGYAMVDANPTRTRLTEEEAYTQLASSARLLKAIAAAIM